MAKSKERQPDLLAKTARDITRRAVKEIRESIGLTQREVAEAMAARGFPAWEAHVVSEIETGKRPLTLEHIFALSGIFACPPAALLATDEPVAVGSTTTPPDTWNAAWGASDWAPQSRGVMAQWRRDVFNLTEDEKARRLKERRERLAAHKKRPGPTFVLEASEGLIVQPKSVKVFVRTLGVEDEIDLLPGVPYVCADRFEVEALLKCLREEGNVRIVDRWEARKLRAQLERSTS